MAIRWDFKEKCGQVVDHDGNVHNWYEGNALMVITNEWKEGDSELYSMWCFFADKDHLKNCCGLTKGHENIFEGEEWQELTIDTKYCHYWKDIITMLMKVMPDCKITITRSKD